MYKGLIVDEFDEVAGWFWYREGQMSYCLEWLGTRRNGWTLEGIQKWADGLGYYIEMR